MNLTEDVRRIALESGAALVGFAPISRFDNAPASVHPHTIYPDTRTAIAIGIPQIRGTLKTIEQGTYWQSYNCDSYWYINEVLSVEILRKICMLLESKGYTSVPVHNPFMPHVGRQIRADQPDGPDGIISLRMVGVAAGLGELGHSKVFLTPEFGPRQRMYAVLTEAELEPTPLFSGKVCDGCLACVRECEACAIGSDRNIEFNIEDQVYSHAALDLEACGVVHRGDDPRYSPFWNGTEKAGEGPGYNQFSQHRFRHLSICGGRGCVRACLDHLEKAGRISSSFKTPFIAENRWKLNEAP